MNEPFSTKGIVNSSGILHEVKDVYMWSAMLIRGTGAIMSMTVIPTLPLDAYTNQTLISLAAKCKEINEMGIPILLRFAPDMNGNP